jgi:hypothetical protein
MMMGIGVSKYFLIISNAIFLRMPFNLKFIFIHNFYCRYNFSMGDLSIMFKKVLFPTERVISGFRLRDQQEKWNLVNRI